MASLQGHYLIKANPILPEEPVEQALNFTVDGIPCTSIAATPSGIYYLPKESDDFPDPKYGMVYDAEEKTWYSHSCRKITIDEPQSVSDDFWLLQNLAEPATITNPLTFRIKDEYFTVAAGISWFTWFIGNSANYRFEPTVDGFVTYDGYIISYKGKNVGIYEFIVSDEYTIEPQARLAISLPQKVEVSPLFAHKCSTGYIVMPNRTYTTPIMISEDYYHALPKERTYLNDYVSYEVANDNLTIWAGDLPANSAGYNFNISVEIARKIYDEMTEISLDIASDKCTVTELAPPYKVNIYGDYYVLNGVTSASISQTTIGFEDKLCHGVVIDEELFPYFEAFHKTLVSVGMLTLMVGMLVECAERIYGLSNGLVNYLNQEIGPEEVLGETVFFADGNIEKIRSGFIAAMAEEEKVSVDEVILTLKSAAAEANMTYEEYLDQMIEAKTEAPINTLRYGELVPLNEEMLEDIDSVIANKANLYSSSIKVQGYTLGGMVLYTMEGSDLPMRSEYSYTPASGTKLFGIYNGEKPITQDFVASGTNDFNITTPYTGIGSQIDSRHYWSIGGYTPPPDRNTPGSVYVTLQTCLAGNTLIEMSDGSQKRLDETCVGDLVKTPYGVERVIFTDAKANKQRNAYTDYYFSDNTVLRVIKNHRVYSPKRNKYVHITTLNIDDTIVKSNGEQVSLVDKKTVQERISHYTIFTENCNGYYANGILCGNIFANIKNTWIRKTLLMLYNKFILSKEQQQYGKS